MIAAASHHKANVKVLLSQITFPYSGSFAILNSEIPFTLTTLKASVNVVSESDVHTWNTRCMDVASFLERRFLCP